MTTRIEQRVFGLPAGSQTITNQTLRIYVGRSQERQIVVFDQDFARTTYVRNQHMSGAMVVDHFYDADSRQSWEVDEEIQLANGESTEIGPTWCRLTITRE